MSSRLVTSAIEMMRGPAKLLSRLGLDESTASSPMQLQRIQRFNRIVRAATELGLAIEDLERGDEVLETRQ